MRMSNVGPIAFENSRAKFFYKDDQRTDSALQPSRIDIC